MTSFKQKHDLSPSPPASRSGPRKSLSGPFNAWLRSLELADRMRKVGEYIRFNTSLPHRLDEFAVLVTAREWSSHHERCAHCPLAIEAGPNRQVAADPAAGKRPADMWTEQV